MKSEDAAKESFLDLGGENELVKLDPDHPGFRDPSYRARRDAIARLALDYREGDPPPLVAYTDQEHAVWRTVWENLFAPAVARDPGWQEGARSCRSTSAPCRSSSRSTRG
jgi:hypothetical protein